MYNELLTAAAFFAIALSANKLHDLIEKLPFLQRAQARSDSSRYVFIGLLLHPSIVEAVRDYTVHFIIYSGHVLSGH